jgi:hypothetical protein
MIALGRATQIGFYEKKQKQEMKERAANIANS